MVERCVGNKTMLFPYIQWDKYIQKDKYESTENIIYSIRRITAVIVFGISVVKTQPCIDIPYICCGCLRSQGISKGSSGNRWNSPVTIKREGWDNTRHAYTSFHVPQVATPSLDPNTPQCQRIKPWVSPVLV